MCLNCFIKKEKNKPSHHSCKLCGKKFTISKLEHNTLLQQQMKAPENCWACQKSQATTQKQLDQEFELLITQRNQLVEALAKTNSTFQKVILATFTSIVTLGLALVTDFCGAKSLAQYGPIFTLFLVQIALILVLFIESILILGNGQRYYISAIDDYIEQTYNIKTLFYQGRLSMDHIIKNKSVFSNLTVICGVIAFFFFVWLAIELDVFELLKIHKRYTILVVVELVTILGTLIYDQIDKKHPEGTKIHRDTITYLKRL